MRTIRSEAEALVGQIGRWTESDATAALGPSPNPSLPIGTVRRLCYYVRNSAGQVCPLNLYFHNQSQVLLAITVSPSGLKWSELKQTLGEGTPVQSGVAQQSALLAFRRGVAVIDYPQLEMLTGPNQTDIITILVFYGPAAATAELGAWANSLP